MVSINAEQMMNDTLRSLQARGYILPDPTAESLILRQRALEYVDALPKHPWISAIALTGSCVIGNSGIGSDIDLFMVTRRASSSLRNVRFRDIVVDISETPESGLLRNFATGEGLKFLTHFIPLYDPSGSFRRFQKKALCDYSSEREYKKEHARVQSLVDERCDYGLGLLQKGHLLEATLPLESCIYEAGLLLVRRYSGVASINLLLDEILRIGELTAKDDWKGRLLHCMRMDLSKKQYRNLIGNHDRLIQIIEQNLSQNPGAASRVRRLKLEGPLSLGKIIEEIGSKISALKVREKIEHHLASQKPFRAGLSLWYESNCDFFIFSPFFYLKNANPNASGKEIASQCLPDLLKYWDSAVQCEWKKIFRADLVTKEKLFEIRNLSHEIIEACR
jgi:hypothetical protein